jgi:hypothetical protein
VLCDGCLSGRVPREVAGNASIELELHHRVTEDDGGASENYRGALTVAGVRYTFEVLLFVYVDGAYFVADIACFEPVEWSAGMRVALGGEMSGCCRAPVVDNSNAVRQCRAVVTRHFGRIGLVSPNRPEDSAFGA